MKALRVLVTIVLAGACTGLPTADPAPSSSSPTPTPTPAPSPTPTEPPRFDARVDEIDARARAHMDRSWRRGCPVPLSRLRLLTLDHWGFDGAEHRGEIVVHQDEARDVLRAFGRLFDARFPIRRMRLVDEYGADDDRSMAANNTSGFNCRRSTGTPSRWSDHAYGRAIDINPVQNPYVTPDGRVLPPAGRRYVDRSRRAQGMILRGDVVVRAFAAIGWEWGGDFRDSKDYQHFSTSGR